MTKQRLDYTAVCDRPTQITDAMVEAGLNAYASLAWHDSASPGSPREVVEAILRGGISAGKFPESAHLDRRPAG